MMPLAFAAAAVAVTVNNVLVRSDVAPIVQHGRVLLPARAVFEALGAEVQYDPATGHVDVRRGTRFVRVTTGSTHAQIGTQPVTLDVAAELYGGRTFVPIRFVAESLGAMVDYDDATRTVSITDPGAPRAPLPTYAAQPGYPPQQNTNGNYAAPSVENRHPTPGESVTSAFPSISATLSTHGGPPIDPNSVRIFLDGRDVTDRMYRSGDDVGFTPSQQILAGPHQVTVQGADQNGVQFTSNWDFQSTYAYSTQPSPQGPAAPGSPYGLQLYGQPEFQYGNTVVIQLIGPPGGRGFVTLCGYGSNYPLQYGPEPNHYYTTITLPDNVYAPQCYVSGYFYDSLERPFYVELPTRIFVNTRDLRPRNRPTPRPTPQPTRPPIILPYPQPTPAPSAQPTRPPIRRFPTPQPTQPAYPTPQPPNRFPQATPTPKPTQPPTPRPTRPPYVRPTYAPLVQPTQKPTPPPMPKPTRPPRPRRTPPPPTPAPTPQPPS
jgi:hypothetical protein